MNDASFVDGQSGSQLLNDLPMTDHGSEHAHGSSSHGPLIAIALLVAVYIVGAVAHWPAVLFAPAAAHTAADGAAIDTSAPEATPHESTHAIVPPRNWWVLPFAILLMAIAVFPLVPNISHWWESNLHRFYVAAGLGFLTLAYYALSHGNAVEAHWPTHAVVESSGAAVDWQVAWAVFANAILQEFIPFIVLLFSLYAISGGIRIEGDLRAHPLTNSAFIGAGGLLASFIGTTGAAMLLIRPLLETNAERHNVKHTVIFFIFVVCNCGGCLLPIGDPPLFLGYLKGVPFTWTFALAPAWLFVNCLLLAVYWAIDHFFFYPHEEKRDIQRDETQIRMLRFRGLGLNGLLLVGVILSVALLDPSKPVSGTSWYPWMYLREVVQLGLVGLSLLLGSQQVRTDNRFNYHAIIEVAALFCGIFICMQPALQILHEAGPRLGVDTPAKFFWATGALSSVLDNAPTYVVFFETATTVTTPEMASVAKTGVGTSFLIAISLGAVFMGAMTYIGNGPNFMVKALAEKSGVAMPSFFGYMAYSVTILLPILALTAWLFF